MKSQPTVHRAEKLESWNQSTVRGAQHLLDPLRGAGCSFGTAVLTPHLGTPRALHSLRITQGEHRASCSSPGQALAAQRGRAGPLQTRLGLPRARPAGARGVGAPGAEEAASSRHSPPCLWWRRSQPTPRSRWRAPRPLPSRLPDGLHLEKSVIEAKPGRPTPPGFPRAAATWAL